MSAIQLIITDAGRAAMAHVAQIGPVTLKKVAIGSAGYVPSASQTSLQKEIKQFDPEGSSISELGIIHITARDSSTENYEIREIGLYTESGILFAVCSQTEAILVKGAGSVTLLAFDFAITNVPPGSVTIGEAKFEYPPASETVKGVAQIATQEEVKAGLDDSTIVTPLKLSHALKSRIQVATAEEIISGKDDTHFITPAQLKPVIDSISGVRNRLINGAFTINQRDPSDAIKKITTSHEYCIDRWMASAAGANVTAQRLSILGGYAYKLSGTEGNTKVLLEQRIEALNCLDLVNQNCVLSFTAHSSSNRTLKLSISSAGKVDNWSSYTSTASEEIEIGASPERYSISFNAGQSAANGISVRFSIEGLTKGESAHFSHVKLEKGIQPTPFEYRPVGLELTLCQRYYERVWGYADSAIVYGINDYYFRQSWTLGVPKRIPKWTYAVNVSKASITEYQGTAPTPSTPNKYILYQDEKNFVTQIYCFHPHEYAWEVVADAEL